MAKYNTAEMLESVQYKASRFWRNAIRIFGKEIGFMPEIKMNSRFTACAGRANFFTNLVEISCYFMENDKETTLEIIVPHELCHIIAFRLYKDQGHGTMWKQTMVKCGLPPDTLHKMETKSQRDRRMA